MIEGIKRLKIGIAISMFVLLISILFSWYIQNLQLELFRNVWNEPLFCNLDSWNKYYALYDTFFKYVMVCTLISLGLQAGMFFKLLKYKRLQRNVMDSITEEAIAKEGAIKELKEKIKDDKE